MTKKLHVAIVGGSFDPIHNGHLVVGAAVLDQCPHIDSVWFSPAVQAHYGKSLTAFGHRRAMGELAVKHSQNEAFYLSAVEDWVRPSSTWMMFQSLKNMSAFADYEFSMVVGMDSVGKMPKWVNFSKLIEEVPFIIVPRFKAATVPASAEWTLASRHTILRRRGDQPLTPDISSTSIRKALYENRPQDVADKVPPEVLAYCQRYKLYEAEL